MSAKVIDFPSVRDAASNRNAQEQHAREQDAKLRAAFAEVVRKVREEAGRGGKLEKWQAIAPAQAVDRLVRECKRRKFKLNEIANTVGDRTPRIRLDRLRVDSKLGLALAKKEFNRNLITKVKPYVDTLERLADVLELDVDNEIYDAFIATDLGTSALRAIDQPSGELSIFIHDLVRMIVEREDLKDFFRECRRTTGTYDFIAETTKPSCSPIHWDQGYEGQRCVNLSRELFPTVPLVRVEGPSFQGRLAVEKRQVAPASSSPKDVTALIWEQDDYTRPNDVLMVSANILLYTDIRLTIAPMKQPEDIGPLFESVSYIELEVRPNGGSRFIRVELSYPHTTMSLRTEFNGEEWIKVSEPPGGSCAAKFDNGWFRIYGFNGTWNGYDKLGAEVRIDATYMDYFRTPFDNGWRDDNFYGWSRVDAETVGKFEDVTYSSDIMDCETESAIMNTLIKMGKLSESEIAHPSIRSVDDDSIRGRLLIDPSHGPGRLPTELRCKGIAREIETAVFTGAIEQALITDSRRVKALLRARIEQARANREADIAELRKRWRGAMTAEDGE